MVLAFLLCFFVRDVCVDCHDLLCRCRDLLLAADDRGGVDVGCVAVVAMFFWCFVVVFVGAGLVSSR